MRRLLLPAIGAIGVALMIGADASTPANGAASEPASGATARAPARAIDWCRTRVDPRRPALPPESPCLGYGPCDYPKERDAYLVDGGTPFLVVRLYIHVFRADDGSDPAATEPDVIARLETLNRNYFPHRIRFVADWTYHDDSTHRYGNGAEDMQMKLDYAFETARRCNIYVRGDGEAAYGYYPWNDDVTGVLGGVVCGAPFFTGPLSVPTHELGHNFGLWHTHHGVSEVEECSPCYERADGSHADTTGDFASDTPPTPVNYTCDDPGTIDPCTAIPWGETIPEDYMSYGANDEHPCWDRFTPQQAARMRCWIGARMTGWLACATDLDDDGDTGFADLVTLLAAWGPCDACNADVDGDGVVGFGDLLLMLGAWGACG